MKLICKLLGHKYKHYRDISEIPYTGFHEVNGQKPHSRFLDILFCQRCAYQMNLNVYMFHYTKEPIDAAV